MPKQHNQDYYRQLDLGRRLAILRESANLSQGDLARRLNRSQAYVSRIETGDRRISVLEAFDWCRAVNSTISQLFPET